MTDTDTIEARPGCAVCDSERHPPKSRDEIMAELREAAEGQLQIARHGSGWALIAKTPFWIDDPHDDHKGPVVLYAGLQSKEAARVALDGAMSSYLDPRCHDPRGIEYISADLITELNAVGRILEVLEESDSIVDLSKPDWVFVAHRAFAAARDRQPEHANCDDECPF